MIKNFKKTVAILMAVLMMVSVLPMSVFGASDGYYTYSVYDGKATITDVKTSISGDITIPSTLGGYTVTSIGKEAFYNCTGLTSAIIPSSVTIIGNYAFSYCTDLTSVTIPDSVTIIGKDAFYNTAYYNNSSNWENNVLYIGNHLIKAKDSISGSYTIKSCTKYITGEAFADCTGLTSVTIPSSVKSIGEDAFRYCTGLTSIVVDKDNKFYDSRENCNAIIETSTNTLIVGCKNTTIPSSVKSIGDSAFIECTGLTSVKIPNSVTSIGYNAFYYCTGLKSLTIPNSVKSIEYCAFEGCSGLKSVTIGNGVKSIGIKAFRSCAGLTSIVVDEDNTYYDSRENCNAIIETSTNTLIVGCKNTTIPNSVTSIGDYAFYSCTGLTEYSADVVR